MRLATWGGVLVGVAVMASPAAVGAQVPFAMLAGADALAPPTPSIGPGGSGGFHLDFDVAFGVSSRKFVSSADVVPDLCISTEPCGPGDFSTEVIRGTVSLGFGSVAIEAFAERPIEEIPGVDWTYGAGGRLDTSPGQIISFQVRMAYIRRNGIYEGQGGRGSLGLLVRPIPMIGGYVEASLDVTTVPESLNEIGTMFGYSYFLGGGLRVYLGI